ncbi:MAG: PKD domain-containing protein [Candidatus Omnitrophica bacterium]|nr:PKD domain-containing protein [Candidatus Omnitrophota bacterium]
MCTKSLKIGMVLLVAFAAVVGSASAYEVPRQNSQAHHLYVFGPEGDPLMGKEDSLQELFVDVPASTSHNVTLRVFDPDTSGTTDWRTDVETNPWNTTTEFTVFGKTKLDSKSFTTEYDGQYYTFGPYSKDQGEKVGDFYRFRLVAKGTAGDDQNLFKVEITPDSAESFVNSMTFRLLPREGERMFFYPEVPAGTTKLIVENYDLDETGGKSSLLEGASRFRHDIADSLSGQWARTEIPISVREGGRLLYVVTKKTQRQANAGLKITDQNGNPVPVYFRRGAPAVVSAPKPMPAPSVPQGKCNTFKFDARSSYDPDNQNLTYRWDFGDGTSSTEPVVGHTYAKAGDYMVTLTVTDDSGLICDTAVSTQSVNVNTPPTAIFYVPEQVCVGQTVALDASGSKDNTPEKLSYAWSLGDGSAATGRTVSKTYEKGGTYKIRLTVDDNSNTACNMDSVERIVKVNTPPVANAGKDIMLCQPAGADSFTVRLDGAGSADADRDNLTYSWDFGDGAKGDGVSPTHTYERPGVYKATLTVSDNSGSSCSVAVDTVNIDLNRAPMANAGPDKAVCLGQEVVLDASGSSADAMAKYSWDLGDGNTATGKVVRHSYEKGGLYRAVVTVDDGKGTTCSTASDAVEVRVNAAPSVDLKDVGNTCVGQTVSFNADASDRDGDAVKLTWDFGDGTVTTGGAAISHKYTQGGFYTVKVTADDGKGSACSLAQDTVYVKVNTPPMASAGQNLVCCIDQVSQFDGSGSTDADGDKLTYRWDFGDGQTGEGAKVSHTYTKAGSYKVVLTVDDGSGTPCSQSSAGFTARVNQKPVSIIKIV